MEDTISLKIEHASKVPLFLRAWWLRDFADTPELDWGEPSHITQPLFSVYSDPICDLSNIDFDLQ